MDDGAALDLIATGGSDGHPMHGLASLFSQQKDYHELGNKKDRCDND